jgi:hypothetical protein
MWNPDLMLTKAVALRRQEAQRTGGDPYPRTTTLAVHHDRQMAVHLRRLQTNLGGQLVCWGRRLQQYGEPQRLAR